MFRAEDALALQRVEVLGERAAEGAEVVALDEEGEERVDFVVGVEDAQEVAGMAVGCDSEDVAERRGEEVGELLFGE